MTEGIQLGNMVFLADGAEGIGAVRSITRVALVVYVENAGDFAIPLAAVRDVHSGKVMLTTRLLPKAFLKAIGRAHDREDPKLTG